MYWFAIASLSPAAIMFMACFVGGHWAWLALLWVTVFVTLMDRFPGKLHVAAQEVATRKHARQLNFALAVVHFALLLAGVHAIAHLNDLTIPQALALSVALGLYMGQVSNSNAHELIHASDRQHRLLGVAIYVSLLFGHHASAHPKVHHVHVATPNDPNSARLGQGFYSFWHHAWLGSFKAGLQAETAARARAASRPSPWSHPFVSYVAGGALAVVLAWAVAGIAGVMVFLAISGFAQMQLLLADYVQHYGLRRTVDENGKPEPASARHSWNATQWYSSFAMLHAPRHSDHHMHPSRQFPALTIDPRTMPLLPSSLPVMATIALVPPLWRAIMDPRVTRWQGARTPE